mmetsp:Transcript_9173/g.24344  ORF Transcript_9173/g.24344 Transcript_9173/m.24344 type:complete len:347 (-) Transcript_9173:1727-2767(-)
MVLCDGTVIHPDVHVVPGIPVLPRCAEVACHRPDRALHRVQVRLRGVVGETRCQPLMGQEHNRTGGLEHRERVLVVQEHQLAGVSQLLVARQLLQFRESVRADQDHRVDQLARAPHRPLHGPLDPAGALHLEVPAVRHLVVAPGLEAGGGVVEAEAEVRDLREVARPPAAVELQGLLDLHVAQQEHVVARLLERGGEHAAQHQRQQAGHYEEQAACGGELLVQRPGWRRDLLCAQHVDKQHVEAAGLRVDDDLAGHVVAVHLAIAGDGGACPVAPPEPRRVNGAVGVDELPGHVSDRPLHAVRVARYQAEDVVVCRVDQLDLLALHGGCEQVPLGREREQQRVPVR